MKKLLLLIMFSVILFSCAEDNLKRVSPATPNQVDNIKSGLNEKVDIGELYTIKSKDFDNVYFVGGYVNKTDIAIWTTGGNEKISLTMSVNNIAKDISVWPYGPNTKAKISMADEGALILKNYIKDK